VLESTLLNHIYERSQGLADKFGQVVVGPGDDCAVVRTASDDLLLATTDQIVSGRHFRPGTPVDRIARKLVARSVSDIAAMGGTPSWALCTGAMPSDYDKADELFDAMSQWGERFGCPLVGGDIATLDGAGKSNGTSSRPQVTAGGQKVVPSFVGKMVLTCTVVGTPHPVRGPVLRSTAKPGDEIWVTGRLGGSLHSGRHLAFSPRLREGGWLCDYLGPDLHAMIDISDGLGRDAGRVAAASGVRIEIDEERLPLNEDVHDWRAGVSDGEDYELCFAIAPGALGSMGRFVCRASGTVLTHVGVAVGRGGRGGAPGCVLRSRDGSEINIAELGWEHGAPSGT
jgi:thiamine-monophosphate kinase